MYKFIKTKDPSNEFDKTNVDVEIPFNDVDLNDLFNAFTSFLKACDFSIDGKMADLVPEHERKEYGSDFTANLEDDEAPPLTDEEIAQQESAQEQEFSDNDNEFFSKLEAQ